MRMLQHGRLPMKPECPYCGATEGLRVLCDGGGYIPPEYTCEACFTARDDGPCFDDLPIVATCERCGGEGRIFSGHPNDPHPRDEGPCPVCDGECVVEIECEPIEMDDLDEMAGAQ
jgi:hypothetical protein